MNKVGYFYKGLFIFFYFYIKEFGIDLILKSKLLGNYLRIF